MIAPQIIIVFIALYFGFLFLVSHITGRKADNASFFIGNRRSPWYIVSIGMIGASISGVTFISVPGWVVDSNFSYMAMVVGFVFGYAFIAEVLLPMFYKLELTSIYTYLDVRFGPRSYKTGSAFFLISRTIGSAFRLYLTTKVLQLVVFDALHVPFWVTVTGFVALIWFYTRKGGIKTVIWTDTFQAIIMLATVITTFVLISKALDFSFGEAVKAIQKHDMSRLIFFDDIRDKRHFIKQFISGIVITVTMTGLDQGMMQKNLSCRSIRDAKKNVYMYGSMFVPINLLFLSLGVMLVMYANKMGIAIPASRDDLFPMIVTQGGLGTFVALLFITGLTAAAYSSSDSCLTALTTSFTFDILGAGNKDPQILSGIRQRVHIMFALLLIGVIMIFRQLNNPSIISSIYTVAGYTYGPLLGMYTFGFFTRRKVVDRAVPFIAVASPIITFIINLVANKFLGGYQVAYEFLLLNGMLTFAGLLIFSHRAEIRQKQL
ncbi:MAG TPA: sodium:solute symporter [Bacteroidales bacterium]|nr:sodium:solute symporter [Bacteroidales bacterium]